jgi:hypothetical protein
MMIVALWSCTCSSSSRYKTWVWYNANAPCSLSNSNKNESTGIYWSKKLLGTVRYFGELKPPSTHICDLVQVAFCTDVVHFCYYDDNVEKVFIDFLSCFFPCIFFPCTIMWWTGLHLWLTLEKARPKCTDAIRVVVRTVAPFKILSWCQFPTICFQGQTNHGMNYFLFTTSYSYDGSICRRFLECGSIRVMMIVVPCRKTSSLLVHM